MCSKTRKRHQQQSVVSLGLSVRHWDVLFSTFHIYFFLNLHNAWGWIPEWLVSSGSKRDAGSSRNEICTIIYRLKFILCLSMYAFVHCVRFITVNLQHCDKPGAKLVTTLSPMLNLVCYVWLYYSWLAWFFVFTCNSCSLSTKGIKTLLLF